MIPESKGNTYFRPAAAPLLVVLNIEIAIVTARMSAMNPRESARGSGK
jgi:hypothetical protein